MAVMMAVMTAVMAMSIARMRAVMFTFAGIIISIFGITYHKIQFIFIFHK
jgi:hypothetical protein